MGTVNPVTVQKAIIDILKANAALVAVLANANQIKEAEWRGKTFSYPAVRVDLLEMVPGASDNCADCWREVRAAIIVLSKDASSIECLTVLDRIEDALERQRLSDTGLTSHEIKIERIVPSDREENIWRGEVDIFTTAIAT